MRGKFLIFSISALLSLVSLTNCAQQCPQCPTCEEKPGGTGGNEGNEGTGGNEGEKPEDPEDPVDPPQVDPSEGLIKPEDSEWSEAITNLMVDYLGGGILPLIDLGEGELDAEFIKNDEYEDYKSYLKIVGGNFLVSRLQTAVKDYKEHYWDALMIGESFFATNDLIKVEVEITRNRNNLFELRAFYNEPFNPKDANKWNEQTDTLIKEHFGRFEVPFTYLGTVNYDSSINEEGALVVSGGAWNDSVINEFETSFKNWEITRDEEVLTTRFATFKEGENTLNATLSKNHNKAELTISIIEGFDSTNQTSWSSEVIKAMDKSLNKTILPYVYLGTIYPTIDTSTTNERNLTLVGKHWDDSILENAKEAFKKDETWKEKNVDNGVSFAKANEFDSYEVTILKNEEGKPLLVASRTEVYNETTLKDYTEELKKAFKEKYDEEISVLPFLYLGTAFPTLNTEIPLKHEEDTNKLVFTGGKYDTRILENFRNKFTLENGWYTAIDNVSEDTGSDYGGNYGDVLAVAIKNTGTFTYKVGLFTLINAGEETAYLEINRSENTGTKSTEWSQETLSNINKVLGGGVTIPHFDTGRDTLEIAFDEYGHLEIQFVADHTNISYRVWSAIDSLTKANWDITFAHNDTYFSNEAWINSIEATKDFNGKKVSIDIKVNPSSYYRFVIFGEVTSLETYDPNKETGTWNEAITTEVKNRYKIDLPYIYLGTDNPYLYEDEEEGTLKIIGNALTNELFANAKEVLSKNGFLIDTGASWDMKVCATKENSDGNIVNIVVGYSDNKPYIEFSLTEIFKPGAETSWDEKTQEILTKELPSGVTLPYLYLGTSAPVATSETFNDVKKITIIGGNWDDAVINLTKTTLESNSFTVSTTSDSLVAYDLLENEDAKAIRLQLSENWDDEIQLDVYVDLKPEKVVEGFAKWESFPKDYSGDNVLQAMEEHLGKVLPEFVPTALVPTIDQGININTPYNQFCNNYIGLSSYSSSYNSYYLYVAMDKLKTEGYEVTFNPFSSDEMAGFSASKKDSEGTIIVTFAPSSGDFNDLENGINISAIYLPDAKAFDNVKEFSESDKNIISGSLDGLLLPYANLGSKTQRVRSKNGEVTITGYNYSETIIENIKKTYSEANWTMNDTYVVHNGKAYKSVSGFLVKDGHTYVLTVTPSISKAVYGGGVFSSSSVTTEIKVVMA